MQLSIFDTTIRTFERLYFQHKFTVDETQEATNKLAQEFFPLIKGGKEQQHHTDLLQARMQVLILEIGIYELYLNTGIEDILKYSVIKSNGRYKRKVRDLKELQLQIEAEEKKAKEQSEESKKDNEEYKKWLRNINAVEKWIGFHIDKDTTSLYEYAQYINFVEEQIEHEKSTIQKLKNGQPAKNR